MRRLFWLGMGLGAGATAAVMTGRWARRQAQALAPPTLARQAARAARDTGALLAEALADFRRGMSERESEIRAALDRTPGPD